MFRDNQAMLKAMQLETDVEVNTLDTANDLSLIWVLGHSLIPAANPILGKLEIAPILGQLF